MTITEMKREVRRQGGEIWERAERLNGNKTYRVCCMEEKGFYPKVIYTRWDIEKGLFNMDTQKPEGVTP